MHTLNDLFDMLFDECVTQSTKQIRASRGLRPIITLDEAGFVYVQNAIEGTVHISKNSGSFDDIYPRLRMALYFYNPIFIPQHLEKKNRKQVLEEYMESTAFVCDLPAYYNALSKWEVG